MKRQLQLILLLVVICSSQTYAQKGGGQISGQVKDPQGKPLAGATVVLQNLPDSLKRQSAIAGQNGEFVFTGIVKGSYVLHVSHIGFQTFLASNLLIDDAYPIQLPLIILQPAAGNALKEVVIISKKPLVEQRIDRTVVNVDAMVSAASSNALDVLAKSPGVMVGANDDITLNGKNNLLVLIDDRPTYMTGQSLIAYLRSLPGSMLDKLELISNPPARYDANGNAIINIVLKKNQAAGFTGAINLGYIQGVYARSNNALNVNYRTPKFNLFSNIGYSHDQNFSGQTYRRYFPSSAILQTSRSTYSSNAYNGRIGMDYFASPKTTFGIILTGSTRPKTDLFNYTASQYNSLMLLDSVGRGSTSGNYPSQNYGVNLNLQHRFDQTGKVLAVNIDQLNYLTGSNQLSPVEVYLPNGNLRSSRQRVFTSPSNIHIYAGKADYTFPMAGKAELSAGLKLSYVNTGNQSSWFDQQGSNLVVDYRKSDHFQYHENINSAYLNLKKDWKQWAVQAGLRLEQTNAGGHQLSNPAMPDSTFTKHYTNLFPSLYLLHKLDSLGNHTLVLSYSRRIRRPSYQQLNPFLFFQDQYSYNGGNTSLSPSFTQYVELRYSYKQYFGLTLSYGGGNNGINSLTQAAGNLLITRPFNCFDGRLIGVIPYISFNPVKWWTLNLNAVILFQTIKGSINGVTLDQHISTHEIETTNQFQLGKNWSAELNGFFPGSQTYGQSKNDAIYNISTGIQKRILHGQGTIRLNANDLLNTLTLHSQTLGINGVSAFNTRASDTRYLGLSFTYRFGKAANARKRNDNGSAEEEKGRTN
ncbi:MAG: TonB-dependent receptor [Bacteroidota bacterium]